MSILFRNFSLNILRKHISTDARSKTSVKNDKVKEIIRKNTLNRVFLKNQSITFFIIAAFRMKRIICIHVIRIRQTWR